MGTWLEMGGGFYNAMSSRGSSTSLNKVSSIGKMRSMLLMGPLEQSQHSVPLDFAL